MKPAGQDYSAGTKGYRVSILVNNIYTINIMFFDIRVKMRVEYQKFFFVGYRIGTEYPIRVVLSDPQGILAR